jgi:hypothetical protein
MIAPEQRPNPSRYARCETYLATIGAKQFFDQNNASSGLLIPVHVFKTALTGIVMSNQETRLYEPWLATPIREIIDAGTENEPLSDTEILRHRLMADPAIHTYDTLAAIGLECYPHMREDQEEYERINKAFDVILASIHHRTQHFVLPVAA